MTSLLRRRWIVALLALLLFTSLPAAAGSARLRQGFGEASGGINRPEHRDKPHVVLVSLDGFKPEYLDRMDLPHLRRVMQRGTRAKSMVPVFPSLTFPNHYSLVTGLHPGRHGIVANRFYDPARKASYVYTDSKIVSDGSWYRGEPIWVTAEKQGMVSACFFWPGSEAPIQGVHASMWNRYDGTIPNADRVKTVIDWLKLPSERRPHLITLYFSEVDTVTHGGPVESPAVEKAAKSLDAAIGQLLDGIDTLPIRDRVYLLITSDHGMVNGSSAQTVPLESLLDASELADIEIGFSGPVANLHVKGGPARAKAIAATINAKLARGTAYLRGELPERFHYHADPRAGDVVVVMDESWTMQVSRQTKAERSDEAEGAEDDRRGQHGWDNAFPSMRATFLILGPGIRQGSIIGEVRNVDVYPLMAELLELRPAADIDGRGGAIGAMIRK